MTKPKFTNASNEDDLQSHVVNGNNMENIEKPKKDLSEDILDVKDNEELQFPIQSGKFEI